MAADAACVSRKAGGCLLFNRFRRIPSRCLLSGKSAFNNSRYHCLLKLYTKLSGTNFVIQDTILVETFPSVFGVVLCVSQFSVPL